MTHARTQSGITLPEVLISLLILALISSAAVYSLRLGVDARDQLDTATDELRGFQVARSLLKEDMAQLVNRRVRDRFGIAQSASFLGGDIPTNRRPDEGELLAAYVRGGWINPNGAAPRSALQYVELVFIDDTIVRRARTFLDDAADAQVSERIMFTDVLDAYTAFPITQAGGDIDWVRAWPLPGVSGDTTVGAARPLAMALFLQIGERAPERHLFWIGELNDGA